MGFIIRGGVVTRSGSLRPSPGFPAFLRTRPSRSRILRKAWAQPPFPPRLRTVPSTPGDQNSRMVWMPLLLLALVSLVGTAPAADGHAPEEGEPQGPWPIFRGDSALTGRAAGSLALPLEVAWSFQAQGAITSSPTVSEGRLYFGSDDGKLYCLDAGSGAEVWAFQTQDIIEAPPLVLDGRVFVGSSDFFFYALNAETGELVWKVETDDKILGGANFTRMQDGARVLVGSYDTYLYCFDPATGETLWKYGTENYVNGTPAILDGRVIFGGCDAVLHVVSATTGRAVKTLELGSECHVAGSAALADGRAYFGHYGNQFVCVDLEKEKVVWSYDSPRHPFFSSPAIGTDRIVFGGRDKRLHCARLADGKPLWSFPTRRKIDSSPVICGDSVVFGSGDGRLYVVGLEDGKERWQYDIGKAILSSPAVVDGWVFVGANDKKLYAFAKKPRRPEKNGQ
ncbi:MAG: Pyrrolo-quinoline quinone [Planctomycetes bacterium]|nr:Pyrrolo-quinoline quinone [Planctomycetota bacterium]